MTTSRFLTAQAYAFKGAFVGFCIGMNPREAPFLGQSCSKNVDKALSINPSDIQANAAPEPQ